MDQRYGIWTHWSVYEYQCDITQHDHPKLDEKVWQEQTLCREWNPYKEKGNVQDKRNKVHNSLLRKDPLLWGGSQKDGDLFKEHESFSKELLHRQFHPRFLFQGRARDICDIVERVCSQAEPRAGNVGERFCTWRVRLRRGEHEG